MQYVSIAYEDRFVEVQPNEGDPLYLLGTSGHGFGAPTIFERTDLGNNKITLRLLPDESGQYWGDKPAGTHGNVTADPQPLPPFVGDYAAGTLRIIWQESPGEEQTFTEIWLPDDTIGLQTNRGTFVTAEGDGNGSPLAISRRELGPWEKFNYLQPPQELLPKPPDPAEGGIEGVGWHPHERGGIRPRQHPRPDLPSAQPVTPNRSALRVGPSGDAAG
jgi:hypothetical protein